MWPFSSPNPLPQHSQVWQLVETRDPFFCFPSHPLKNFAPPPSPPQDYETTTKEYFGWTVIVQNTDPLDATVVQGTVDGKKKGNG